MGRFIVTVIDGFGIGAMPDASLRHPEDDSANTAASILQAYPNTELPLFQKLGLGNLVDAQALMKTDTAIWGRCRLMHDGADTFMGHQEIMGTRPTAAIKQRLEESLEEVQGALQVARYTVRIRNVKGFRYLIVNEACVISDNIDSDLGQAINCIATFDLLKFEELLDIAQIVRSIVTCNRVIAFGGTHTTLQDLIQAEEVKEQYYIGNVAVKTGVYEHDYQVRHLGYGVNSEVQVPALLHAEEIESVLIGKVADIVENPGGKRISCVDSKKVFDIMEKELLRMKHGFLCMNIQESDLAGHSMNTEWYRDILKLCDKRIENILCNLQEDDIFVVCADHGNDPEIGHNHHTREYVPLLVYGKHLHPAQLGTRTTLSDIGATICDYFHCKPCENGTSFLSALRNQE